MRKVKIISHGNTWIDTSTPIVCPECASLNVEKDTFQYSKWHGPFKIENISQQFYCKDCHCRFSIDKDRKKISTICLDAFCGYLALITIILFFTLLMIALYLYHDSDAVPLPMTVILFITLSISIISFFTWLILQ